jgi:hypothetical protein
MAEQTVSLVGLGAKLALAVYVATHAFKYSSFELHCIDQD